MEDSASVQTQMTELATMVTACVRPSVTPHLKLFQWPAVCVCCAGGLKEKENKIYKTLKGVE